MKLFRAWVTLLMLSFRRLLWSMNTGMVMFPLLGCALFLMRRNYPKIDLFPDAFNAFSEEFVLFLFASFIVPVCALAYGTTSIGGDREDRTLLFLLVRPIPRTLIFLAKLSATLPLVIGLVVISFFVFCRMAGDVGRLAFELYLPAVFYMTLAYVSLFHLFAVMFRHATIVALIYSLFLEFFIGNMPGIIKRVAVSYYGRSMMFDLGAAEGLDTPDPNWFVPMSAHAAGMTLVWISAIGMLLAIWIFARREFRDLT